MLKQCYQCKIDQPLDQYYATNGRPNSYCKTCTKENSARRYAGLSPEEQLLIKKKTKASKYGMTLAEFEAYVDAHGDLCDICGRPEDTKRKLNWTRNLTMDHDHVTGKTRGMLCSRCNLALGFMREDVDAIRRMIEYLER